MAHEYYSFWIFIQWAISNKIWPMWMCACLFVFGFYLILIFTHFLKHFIFLKHQLSNKLLFPFGLGVSSLFFFPLLTMYLAFGLYLTNRATCLCLCILLCLLTVSVKYQMLKMLNTFHYHVFVVVQHERWLLLWWWCVAMALTVECQSPVHT